MKWLSIKEFIPPTSTDLLLRIIIKPENNPYVYDRYLIANLECLYDNLDNPFTWDLANGATVDINLDDYLVTHFAILDGVPIDKEFK
jgi:hypothetical protein